MLAGGNSGGSIIPAENPRNRQRVKISEGGSPWMRLHRPAAVADPVKSMAMKCHARLAALLPYPTGT